MPLWLTVNPLTYYFSTIMVNNLWDNGSQVNIHYVNQLIITILHLNFIYGLILNAVVLWCLEHKVPASQDPIL